MRKKHYTVYDAGNSVSYHQSPHPLFLDSFRLLLLLSLCVGVPCCNGFRKLLDFSRDGPVDIPWNLLHAAECYWDTPTTRREQHSMNQEQNLEFGVGKIRLWIKQIRLCLPRLFLLINGNIVKYYYNLKWQSWIFSTSTPVFSFTRYFQNHYNTLNWGWRNHFYYQLFNRILCWIESSKEQHLFEIDHFCNIIFF